jgi:hypothetical protein
LQANRTPEAAAEFLGNKLGRVSFTRPRDRNEETVAQGTFVGGLTGAALRQVRRHAAIIAWMRSTMSPTSRVRLVQDTKRSKKSQVAGEAAERAARLPKGTRNGRRENSACLRALARAEVDLVDSTSESDTSDPGGRPQLFRDPTVLGACSPKKPRMRPGLQVITRRSALKPAVAAELQKKTGEQPLLRKHEHKIHQGGATNTGVVLRVAQEAREEDNREVRGEVAVQRAEEKPTADARRESPRFRLLRGAGTDPNSMEVGDDDARAPAPDQPPEETDGFARELASTMSAIASLVIKASGRSVSDRGWLYFNRASKDYRTFRTNCRLFQETYHKATPPMALVKMFRGWNLAEDVAWRIKGVEDMPAAWRALDAIYGTPLALTMDQTPEAGWMPEPQEEESGVGSEAGPTSEEEPAPLQARGAAAFRIVDIEAARPAVEAAISPQGKHVFINTPHGIRCLRRLWVRGEEPEHTVVSQEVAHRYSMRAESRRQVTRITGPTGCNGWHRHGLRDILADGRPARAHQADLRPHGELSGEVLRLAHRGNGRVRDPAGEGPRGTLVATAQGSAAQDRRTPFRALGRDDLGGSLPMPKAESTCGSTSSGATSERSRRLRWPPAAGSAATSQRKDACSQCT